LAICIIQGTASFLRAALWVRQNQSAIEKFATQLSREDREGGEVLTTKAPRCKTPSANIQTPVKLQVPGAPASGPAQDQMYSARAKKASLNSRFIPV
jgi:hypothetical protein